jgi:hypothetical protein
VNWAWEKEELWRNMEGRMGKKLREKEEGGKGDHYVVTHINEDHFSRKP